MNNLRQVYKRIELPPRTLYYHTIDQFVIESLAKPQWRKLNNERSYTLTPFTYFVKSKEEYYYWGELQKIQQHTSYFMKPYNILAYGNNYMNPNLDSLMVRGWLHEDKKNNLNILLMIEKMNREQLYDNSNKYYYILNNPHWYPSLKFFEKRKELRDDEIIQEINYEKVDYEIK